MNTPAAEPLIGVINAGSSSLKFSFYEGERRILSGQVDGIGAQPSASAAGPDGEKLAPPDLGAKPPTVPSEVLPAILPWAREWLGDRGSRRSAIASSMADCITRDRPASP